MSGQPDPQPRVRKSVKQLPANDPILTWYAKAVAAMKARPATDPTSWEYQASVHGVMKALKGAEQKRFWAQCQHQTWFFLPWHRGYLAVFEEIVAKTVVGLGGPAGWALPYWNYSDGADPNARLLPDPFVKKKVAGKTNPLWSPRGASGPDLGMTDADVSLAALTKDKLFTGADTGAHPGFGGPQTGFSHAGGVNGGLEMIPHNYIHDAVGGLMGDPRTAAHDPIFWLHHANIDRLWEVWLKRDASHADPTAAAWLSGPGFELRDSNNAVFSFGPKDVLVTRKVRHGYVYDNVSDPVQAGTALHSQAMLFNLVGASSVAAPAAQMVGASGAVTLGSGATDAKVDMHPAAAPKMAQAFAQTRPPRVFLNLENVTSKGGATGSYEVYVNTQGAKADQPPMFAGLLSLFGVAAASDPAGPHGGSGVTSVLEITEIANEMKSQGRWNDKGLVVSFRKRHPERVKGQHPPVQVGRISVYFA